MSDGERAPVRDIARLALAVSYVRPLAASRWLADTFGFGSPGPMPQGDDTLPGDGEGHSWIEFRLGDSSLMVFKGDHDPAADPEGHHWTFAQARPTMR